MVFGHLPLIKWNTHPIFHFKLLLEIGEGGLKITLSHRPWVLVRIQRRIWGITCGKNKFIKERAERTPRRRGGQNQERHWCRNDEVWGVFKTGFLYIHLTRRGLTILIDISKLHNNRLYCTGLFHNSVCYNQMYRVFMHPSWAPVCLRLLGHQGCMRWS